MAVTAVILNIIGYLLTLSDIICCIGYSFVVPDMFYLFQINLNLSYKQPTFNRIQQKTVIFIEKITHYSIN